MKPSSAVLLAPLFALALSPLALAAPPATTTQAHPSSSAHANAVAGQADATRIEACVEATEAFLGNLGKSDFKAATSNFDAKLLAALGPKKLAETWLSITAQFGTLESQGAAQNLMYQGYAVVTVPLHFRNGTLGARLACSADGKFAGFHIVPMPSAAPPASK